VKKHGVVEAKLLGSLLVQDNTEERIVDFDSAVVFDETELPQFVHEHIYTGASCPDHSRQSLLRYLRQYLFWLVLLAISREHQQSPRQPFLNGIEELIDQVLLDSDVSSQHIGDEAVGKLVFPVEHPKHFLFFNYKYRGRCNRGRRCHANHLARQAAFSQKITRAKNRDNSFFTGLIHDSKLHAAFLDVHDILGRVALREDGFLPLKLADLSSDACRAEKRFHIERNSS
jgi:hypothetical protein